jgi:hypothetical protein
MTSIDIETIMTIIYVCVDNWYQRKGSQLLQGKVGVPPVFSDSEVITLMLAEDYIPYPGEKQFLGYIRANHLGMFPELISQSQFNRRARGLRLLVEALRREWLVELGIEQTSHFLLDTKPVPVMGYKRSKKHSDFAGSAAYGYCSSRNLHYYGYKLVMVTTLDGLPVLYELVPANIEERQAAETVLDRLANGQVFGDKGFLGEEWQAQIERQTGNRVITPKRVNQIIQHPDGFERLLNSIRERIEGVFHEIQNTGRHLEHLQAKTVVGLVTRVITKVASHLLRYLLRCQYGIDIQTFQCSSEFAV